MSLAMSSTLSTRRKTRGSGHKTLPIALHPTTVRGSSQVESILTMHAKGLERQHPSNHKQPKRRQRPRAKSEAPAVPLPRPWSSASAFSQASLLSEDSNVLYPDESALKDGESKRPWSVERRSASPKRFTSIAVNDQVQVLEAINQRRADNEQSTLIALQSSLAYLRKCVMQSPEMEHAQDSLLAALSTLEECSIHARGTPTCFAAQYAEQVTRDQAIEIEQLQRDLDAASGMVTKLQGEKAHLETQLSASREDNEEGKIREEKLRQYVHRLRQDLMSSFDDLKLIEANKDHATALAKHRTLELTAVEQKLQQTQNAAQSLKHNLEHTHGKFNDATSELAALRRENEALRAHIENPSENPILAPVAKTISSFDDTPEGSQGRHAL